MTDEALTELAAAAGLECQWRDVFGRMQAVPPDTLRAILAALDLPTGNAAQLRDSQARLATMPDLPPLLTAEAGQPIALPVAPGQYCITLEDGSQITGRADTPMLPAIALPGYHRLEFAAATTTLAIAPRACFGLNQALAAGGRPDTALWGLAVQLYGLRRAQEGGIGDFTALREAIEVAARHGAAALAISPVHAQFSADPDRFSPYAPSSRAALNVLHADPGALAPPAAPAPGHDAGLVDWPVAGRQQLGRLRAAFAQLQNHPALAAEFAAFRVAQGVVLEQHAQFEALHGWFFGQDQTLWHWRDWPAAYRQPGTPEVAAFARTHADEIAFHAFAQFLADRGLAAAQSAARQSGMALGLISDLAVGADGGGSQCWSRQDETLLGLSIGAPPDLLSTAGQDWGLTSFSPRGLVRHGFGAFLDMLRTALRHAGGVRIDHVMGLARLWVLPRGASANQGAYLRYPVDDLLRLLALESHRAGAVVLGEDLGTLPEGFQARLERAGVLGLRVLWFEHDGTGFRPPGQWTRNAVAMTSTHDLATVAGWWAGRDLEWRTQMGLLADPAAEQDTRMRDRADLWAAFRASGATAQDAPPPAQAKDAASAAAAHLGQAACRLALLPIEDALALPEQPNLPGTLAEHPNWRRRLAAPLAELLAEPASSARLAALAAARERQP